MKTEIESREGAPPDPVERLITLGKPANRLDSDWPNYPALFGLSDDHIGTLIALACDLGLNQASRTSPEVWAPLHAWRALGQLRAEAAVAPLLATLEMLEDDDYARTERPKVFGLIGPAAVPHIAAFLSNRARPMTALGTAIAGLPKIVADHPEYRDESIAILAGILQRHPQEDWIVNGFAVSALLDLQAVEAIDAIRAAFGRGVVDLSISGDLEDVEIELGLKDRRITPARRHPLVRNLPSLLGGRSAGPNPQTVRQEKTGRKDPCPRGSGKKYKKCCLQAVH